MYNTGWLTPAGELIKCDGYAHLDMAREIIKHFNLFQKEGEQPDDTLLRLGWVRISKLTLCDVGYAFWMPRFPTTAQRDYLTRLNEEYHDFISETGLDALREYGIA